MMYLTIVLLASCVVAGPVYDGTLQTTLSQTHTGSPRLHGRFLHITDLHPDPHYLSGTSDNEEHNCHRGHGSAGHFGAPTTECDTPFSLMNATFAWIDANLADSLDFVIWTGDSARHDADERIPRNHEEVLDTNRRVANKFIDVFHKDGNGKTRRIPVVPTFGNNDILPHNILLAGPNKWLRTYRDIWSEFIPEEQRHGFERGGWFYQEVIPDRLAVFSLNTLYFFSNNAGVDGCEMESEPGYEHMEWLRIQLEFMRQRGMKAMLMGHVPPARTDSKRLWDESCWQKYTLWLKQYRDVVVGGFFGHMNVDHFVLQDTKHLDIGVKHESSVAKTAEQPEFGVSSASSYLKELRGNWGDLPDPRVAEEHEEESKAGRKERKEHKRRRNEVLKHMGGPWAERFQVTLVNPSVVPNYFPTMRVYTYNITGLEHNAETKLEHDMDSSEQDDHFDSQGKKHKKQKKHKKKKGKHPGAPKLIIPDGPSETSPPGPAYSPQTFSLKSYTQYFANLTWINQLDPAATVATGGWLNPDEIAGRNHSQFTYEVEYDTATDKRYKLHDLTVKSWLKLAHRIGQFKGENIPATQQDDWEEFESATKKHPVTTGKHNKVWLEFVRRAFVGTISDKKLGKFAYADGVLQNWDVENAQQQQHKGEI